MPASGLRGGFRERFTLWWWDGAGFDREVTGHIAQYLGVEGGPYHRSAVAEKMAERVLVRRPRAAIWITREVLELRERPRASPQQPSVIDNVWTSTGIVWQNPAGDFPSPPSQDPR
jgi:hypothetical protein